MSTLLAIVGAYLLGSFPSGVVLGRLSGAPDVRTIGSGNIGAANAARAGGTALGVAVAVADALKGLIAVVLARWLGLSPEALALVALASVVGHDFSLYLGFRGGKGVATTVGVALALAPGAAIVAIGGWLIALVATRYFSLSSLLALALLPLVLGVMGNPPASVVIACLLFLLALGKHAGNIGRIMRGTEPRVDDRG